MFDWVLKFLHFIIIIWALVAPFTKELRPSFVIIAPFIMLHWILLDDTCILTLIENKLRGCGKEETFMHQLVSPMYNLPEGLLGTLMWVYMVITWLYAVNNTSFEEIKKSLWK
jgi:hypothetical protein